MLRLRCPRRRISTRQRVRPRSLVAVGGAQPARQMHGRTGRRTPRSLVAVEVVRGWAECRPWTPSALVEGEDLREVGQVVREVGHVDREVGHVVRDDGHVDREEVHVVRDIGHVDREEGHVVREVGHVDLLVHQAELIVDG
eukprot:13074557-Heterocapsa_arctica.AAC.1